MEDDKRQFQPIKINVLGDEHGTDRFKRAGWIHLPPTSHWRNNLTALSQRYNLYFVASHANISVYQPRFPLQKLGSKPSLTISPTVAESEARGYIDQRRPHAVNHLLTGDLGHEEILLVATDSGNVAAYHTRAIRDAIEKDPYKYNVDARAEFVGLRAFFSQWVHESAWGLSIHSTARMIAVSANTPHHVPSDDPRSKITVFAFALTSKRSAAEDADKENNEDEVQDQLEWDTWVSPASNGPLQDRSKNWKIVLSGHEDNIPSLSFINSMHDREGNWLLGTDIGGQMKLWRIWSQSCYRSWNFSTAERQSVRVGAVLERGWSVLALDIAAFRYADTLEEFCGISRPLKYFRYTDPGESYDMTNYVRSRIPSTSQNHPGFLDIRGSENEDQGVLEDSEPANSDDESDEEDSGGVQLNAGRSVPSVPILAESDAEDEDIEMDEAEHLAAEGQPGEGEEGFAEESERGVSILDENEDTISESSSEPSSGLEVSHDDDEVNQEEATNLQLTPRPAATTAIFQPGPAAPRRRAGAEPGSSSIQPANTIHFSLPRKFPKQSTNYQAIRDAYTAADSLRKTASSDQVPVIPTLHCTTSQIRFINLPSAKTPHFFCASALRQYLPGHLQQGGLPYLDRMNMVQYIPELGLVIIASQIGRCAVCTLTRRSDTGTLGFRVDWILPTKEQERKRSRPIAPLLGIAASPVQGMVIGDEDSSNDESDGEVDEQDFTTDRLIDGAPTTFDPYMVALGSSSSDSDAESDSGSKPQSPQLSLPTPLASQTHSSSTPPLTPLPSPNRKRSHSSTYSATPLIDPSASSSSAPAPEASNVKLVPARRPSTRAIKKSENWHGIRTSRVYRLLLTYYDHTVLAYELCREQAELGLGEKKNYRNRRVG